VTLGPREETTIGRKNERREACGGHHRQPRRPPRANRGGNKNFTNMEKHFCKEKFLKRPSPWVAAMSQSPKKNLEHTPHVVWDIEKKFFGGGQNHVRRGILQTPGNRCEPLKGGGKQKDNSKVVKSVSNQRVIKTPGCVYIGKKTGTELQEETRKFVDLMTWRTSGGRKWVWSEKNRRLGALKGPCPGDKPSTETCSRARRHKMGGGGGGKGG